MRSKFFVIVCVSLSFLLFGCDDGQETVSTNFSDLTEIAPGAPTLSEESSTSAIEIVQPIPIHQPLPADSEKSTDASKESVPYLPTCVPSDWGLRDKSASVVSEDDSEDEKDVPVKDHIKISLQSDGWDIFRPNQGMCDYRYGASIISGDNGMDAYFAAPGDVPSEFDCITHSHSDDGGKTWSDESVVLTPMPLSRDYLSVCDPDIFFYDGYYYLGYTGTMDATKGGVVNSAFVARSKNVDGPFEKWNGTGWGENPMPLVYYDGFWNCWGVGEPAFVVHDDVLYVYCTKAGCGANGGALCCTAVYTADLKSDNWPSTLCFEGYAVDRTSGTASDDYIYHDSDSWDVVYDNVQKKFIAISTNRRFLPNSCLVYYESTDGVHFNRVSELNSNVYCGSHNAGFVSDKYGHIGKNVDKFVVYSYGGSNNKWGAWSTRLAPIDVIGVDDIDKSEDSEKNISAPIEYGENAGQMSLGASVRVDNLVKYGYVGMQSFGGSYSYRDSSGDISSIDFDSGVSLDKEQVTGLTVNHNGANRQLKFCVLPANVFASINNAHGGIRRFVPPMKDYTVSLSGLYAVTIRPMLEYNDYTLYELTVGDLTTHGVTFMSLDPNVCAVRSDGTLIPVQTGTTTVIVSLQGILSFAVDVTIVE